MSGGIFTPLENLCELDNANCHPLVCFLCHEQYEHPCLLDCYHNFCASCLRGRAIDSRLACPLCGHQSVVKGNGLPPEDQLLKFLVDSSGDYEEDVLCANCDLQSTKQELDAMYFCNTCSQPLCARCREETHKARMFSRHEIVSLSKRAKEVHKKCPLHEELYIMFSTEKKSMLCINCFRDMPVELLKAAVSHVAACPSVCPWQAVKELQTSTREAIVLLKAMIEEVRNSADEESSAINALFGSMQRKQPENGFLKKSFLSQYEEKEKAFKEQLSHLASLLPTLQVRRDQFPLPTFRTEISQPRSFPNPHLPLCNPFKSHCVHLVTCSAFLSSANKAEFLDLGYINSEYRADFAHCLEPLLPLSPRWAVTLLAAGCSSSLEKMPLAGSPVRKATMHRYISTKVLLAEGRETPFTDHCAAVRDPEPERPGAGAPPRPHQAPLPHQDGERERNPAEIPPGGRPDCLPVLVGGNETDR
ncbi:RING finger protein, partial [Ophiophagus hannah]